MFEKIKKFFLKPIKPKFVWLFLLVIFIVNIVDYFFYFSVTIKILSVFVLAFILMIIIDLFRSKRSIKKFLINLSYIIIIILVFIVSSKTGYYFSDYLRRDNINRFDNIAVSIEKFKEEKGIYPNSLNELVEYGYVDEIPKRTCRRFTDIKYENWISQINNNEEDFYFLCFDDEITGENFCFNECELWGSIITGEKYLNGWMKCYPKLF